MKIVVAQHNAKVYYLIEHQLNFDSFIMFVYYVNFNEAVCRKRVFSHVVFNDLRNDPWTALIACANFSPET